MTSDAASRDPADIAATLKTCLLSVLGSTIQADLVQEDTNLFDIGIDSMNMTELLLGIEKHFNFTIAPEDLSSDLFLRFANLTAFVQFHVSRT
ncbi:MAG TPA: acyl carrier protein [Paraburkholderia sp.]|jgi:acyl carrier protein|nr:acyl carrier protein [Paraburkholderia sp.]